MTSGETAIVVQHIHERGAAKAAGLRIGDKIISVNGTTLIGATHTQAVHTIRFAIPSQVSGHEAVRGGKRSTGKKQRKPRGVKRKQRSSLGVADIS